MLPACPTCALPYKPGDIYVAEGVAVCRACDGVKRLGLARPAHRPEAKRPPGWLLEEAGGGLLLKRRWMMLEVVFLVIWCVIWNLGALGALASGGITAIVHVVAGLVVSYVTLAFLVNSSTIEVRSGRLRVTHGPLPWPGNVDLETRTIDQLYVELTGVRVSRRPRWQVICVDHDRVARKIGPLVASVEEGRWVEQRIEEHIGVRDRDVAGEAWGAG